MDVGKVEFCHYIVEGQDKGFRRKKYRMNFLSGTKTKVRSIKTNMPLYEYRCGKCGKLLEVLQKYIDPELTEHDCGGILTKIMTSPPAVRFTGTGWTEKQYK